MRFLTYNVHRWLGTDRRVSPGRIADVIASCRPDVVALQEVRIRRPKPGETDPANAVAHQLGMTLHFHPTVRFGTDQFGIAVLTRRPSRVVRAARLPGWPGGLPLEPRGAIWVEVEGEGGPVQVIATHLGLLGPERLAQANALLGPDWIGHPGCTGPVVVLGDLNAAPESRAYKRLAGALRDVQLAAPDPEPRATFHTRLPILRIDHIFVNASVEVMSAEAVRTPLARVASDHLPLLAELRVGPAVRSRAGLAAATAGA